MTLAQGGGILIMSLWYREEGKGCHGASLLATPGPAKCLTLSCQREQQLERAHGTRII